MTIINLYRYENADGSVSVTPNPHSETDIPSGVRLIADEGMELVKGDIHIGCIDADTADGWTETGEATIADYKEALERLGVKTDE